MNRRQFVGTAASLTAAAFLYSNLQTTMSGPQVDLTIRSLRIEENGKVLKVHAIPTGTVAVKQSHRGRGLGITQILADFRWTEPMPIYCWCIEHPEGILLFDTGERVRALDKNYYDCGGAVGWVNRKILRFDLTESMEINARLDSLGIQCDAIRWVLLSHLHLDHVDGLHHFSKSEVIVAKDEWQNPSGAINCLFPNWLKPRLIQYSSNSHPLFAGTYPLTSDGLIQLIPTPGHSFGHQSLLIQCQDFNILLAGDLAFSEQQFLQRQIAGISADKKAARKTYQQIANFQQHKPLLFLPSHDPLSGRRLQNKQFLS